MEELEEIINDPGNQALLKESAKQKEIKIEELAEKTGMDHSRTKDKIKALEKKKLVQLDRSEIPAILKLNRENLKKLNKEIKQFHKDKRHVILDNLEDDKELLQQAKEELKEKKNETTVVTKQKRFESQIEAIQKVIEKIDSAKTDNELFNAHASTHRVLKLTESRDKDFHSFNPYRKLKASRKIDGILENEPEEEKEPRRFFGNRWVKRSRLEQ